MVFGPRPLLPASPRFLLRPLPGGAAPERVDQSWGGGRGAEESSRGELALIYHPESQDLR